jgi:hypothetical protein
MFTIRTRTNILLVETQNWAYNQATGGILKNNKVKIFFDAINLFTWFPHQTLVYLCCKTRWFCEVKFINKKRGKKDSKKKLK